LIYPEWNPFNGIESYKHDLEVKMEVNRRNPFNGIERLLKALYQHTLQRMLGIHSMELKD